MIVKFKNLVSQVVAREPSTIEYLVYFLRGLQIIFLNATKSKKTYKIRSDFGAFKMIFLPTGSHSGSQGYFLFRENYEQLMKFGNRLISKSGQVIDAGANQGIFSVAFSIWTSNTVVAIEPIPWQVKRLENNLQINNINNCHIVEAAVSSTNTQAYLDLSKGDVSASIADHDQNNDDKIQVETVNIDYIVSEHKLDNLELIKLDVEGVELIALQGAKSTLERIRPTVCIEAHDQDELEAVIEYLGYWNYKPHRFDDRGNLVALEAEFVPRYNVFFISS